MSGRLRWAVPIMAVWLALWVAGYAGYNSGHRAGYADGVHDGRAAIGRAVTREYGPMSKDLLDVAIEDLHLGPPWSWWGLLGLVILTYFIALIVAAAVVALSKGTPLRDLDR